MELLNRYIFDALFISHEDCVTECIITIAVLQSVRSVGFQTSNMHVQDKISVINGCADLAI